MAVDATGAMGERTGRQGDGMRRMVFAAMLGWIAAGMLPAGAEVSGRTQATSATQLSAQERRVPPRVRVYPGRLLHRECEFHLVPQWRPSGTVIVPWQRCWWVRG